MNLNANLSLGKLPWYAQVGVFGALSVAGVAAFYFLYASPVQASLAERQTRLEKVRTDIDKGLDTARRLPAFKLQVDELEARLDSLKSVLPEEKDVAELLRQLETLARQSNLKIGTFKPAFDPITRDLYAEWPYELQIEGTYHNLALFFDRISRFSRIINIRNLDIRARDKQETNVTITVRCVAATFVLIEPAPGGTPAAKASAAAKKAGTP